MSVAAGLFLAGIMMIQNYDLVFNQYADEFSRGAWNTREIGEVVRSFTDTIGSPDTAWTVGFPYWVDTRLVAINAGMVTRDTAIWPDQFANTLPDPRAKLFIINPQDNQAITLLTQMYPTASLSLHTSPYEGKNFLVLLVPAMPGSSQ